MSVKITWYGHACFTLETGGYTVAIDPYDPSVKGYPPLSITADEVFSSHGHFDHNYLDAVRLLAPGKKSPFSVRSAESFHDASGGSERGENLIRIFETGGLTLLHLGDLGHALTEDLLRQIGRCDVLMIPVGGFYTIDAAEAARIVKQLAPPVVIPMHYRFSGHGPDVIATVDEFLGLADREIVRYAGNEITVSKDTKPQVALLSFRD